MNETVSCKPNISHAQPYIYGHGTMLAPSNDLHGHMTHDSSVIFTEVAGLVSRLCTEKSCLVVFCFFGFL